MVISVRNSQQTQIANKHALLILNNNQQKSQQINLFSLCFFKPLDSPFRMIDSSDTVQFNDRSRKSWNENEDNVLIKLVKKYGVKRWNDISKAMVEMFEITTKSGKQCRQRWVNHLDPKINKKKWTLDEEKKIFEAHKIHGNKWKIIARQLDSRTDNSIKNHFYSILRKGLRRINKIIGDRKSTEIIKHIRTSVLSKLDKSDQLETKNVESVNTSKIYELLFQFSSMRSGNVSQQNLTIDLKNDFKQMISQLMQLSSMEKIKKDNNIALNKERKNRKNSINNLSEIQDQNQDQNDSLSAQKDIEFQQEAAVFFSANLTKNQIHSRFMVNLDIQERPKQPVFCEKFQMDEIQQEKASQLINLINQCPHKPVMQRVIEQKFEILQFIDSQKSEQFNLFPNIMISLDQAMISNDFNINCFNKSPLFASQRMADHFNIRTPRVPSPGAFNFCSGSTAQSMGNFVAITKEAGEQKSMAFDNELEKIVEQLKSNINTNCSSGSVLGLRVSSSRNSCAEPCLKGNSSGIFLTPRSGSGKAH